MNKQEYMKNLFEALSEFDSEISNEIIDDYEQRFEDGLKEGKSEEQIIEELGDIDELIAELKELRGDNENETTKKKDVKDKSASFDKFAKSFAGTIGAMAATITNETEKIINSTVNGATSFGETVANDFTAVSEKVISKSTQVGEKVLSKSTSFVNEVVDSFNTKRNSEPTTKEEAATAAECTAETATADCTAGTTTAINNDAAAENAPAEDVHHLIMEVHCGNINITESADNNFHVSYQNHGTANQKLIYKFDFTQQNDTAYVSVTKQRGLSAFFKGLICPRIDLNIEVPHEFGNIKLNTLAGNFECTGITAEDIFISSMAGNVDFDACYAKSITSNSMAGNVKFTGCDVQRLESKSNAGNTEINGIIKDLIAVSTAGDIRINGSYFETITTTATAGNTKIELNESTGYETEINTAAGNVNLYYGETSVKGFHSGKYKLGDGFTQINSRATAGNIDIIGSLPTATAE